MNSIFKYSVSSGDTSNDSVVDSAVSLFNFEESLVTPLIVPRVGAQPIVESSFNSPSDDLNSVSSQSSSGSVYIDSGLIGQEVFIDGERGFNRSVSKDLLLDVLYSSN